MRGRGHRLLASGWFGMLVIALAPAAVAGGPEWVNVDGRPFVWDNSRPIAYTMDPGPFGRFSNALASQWVAAGFQQWAKGEGVSLSSQATAPFSTDVTGRNALQILDQLPDNVSLIILDHDGGVLEAMGMDSEVLYGFGTATGFDTRNGKITQGLALLSGRFSREQTADWFQGSLVEHELGHFLGLTHSQLNPQVTYDGDPNDDNLATRMSYDDGPNSKPGLHLEDRAWIAWLYPKLGAPKTTGTIRGRILAPDGVTGLQGVQVQARKEGDEEATAVSGISGFRYRIGGFGSRDAALQGVFELPGLPEGSYRLSIVPLTEMPHVSPRHSGLRLKRFWRDGEAPVATEQEATPVTVVAGQVVEGKDFVIPGPALPSNPTPELEPNDVPELAATTPLPALISGRVRPQPQDGAYWILTLPGNREDAVEDWHRIVVTEPTLLSMTLTAANGATDLNLFLIDGPFAENVPSILDASDDPGPVTETIQGAVPPGVYFVGVSSFDSNSNPATEYRLAIHAIPISDPPVAAAPRITLATVSHLSTSSLRVTWQTDQETNAVLIAGRPQRELGSTALTRDHTLEFPGLAQDGDTVLQIFSRNAEGALTALPVVVHTPVPATGRSPILAGGLWRILPQDEKGLEQLLMVRLTNFGNGIANNSQVTRLALSTGWRFTVPPTLPIDMGAIGPGASTVLFLRVERDAGDAPPLDLSVAGTYQTVDGSQRGFGR